MRNTLKYLNDLLALLTLPIYLLAPLAALAGRAFGSLALDLLPPSWAFIASDVFLVIAAGLFLWYSDTTRWPSGNFTVAEIPAVWRSFLLSLSSHVAILVAGAVFEWLKWLM